MSLFPLFLKDETEARKGGLGLYQTVSNMGAVTLQVVGSNVSGPAPLVLTGELTDHIPALAGWADGKIDPLAGELRVTSPLLLRGDKVVHDFEGAIAVQKDRFVVQMYIPGQGLWVLSLHPLPGAVEARVDLSRIKFEINGRSYMFLMATPVTRNEHIWVMHVPNYRPSDPQLQDGFIGGADPDHLANSQP